MSMTKVSRSILIGAFAVATLYIPGCGGVSFSPDDSKLLFPINDLETGNKVLAMYDRTTRTIRPIFTQLGRSDWREAIRPAWTADGSHAMAFWEGSDDTVNVALIPVNAPGTVRFLRLEEITDFQPITLHPIITGPFLIFADQGKIRRIDLRNGKEDRKETTNEVVLVPAGGRAYYMRRISGDSVDDSGIEFGLLDAASLELSPIFEPAELAGSDDIPFFGVSDDGAHLAVLSEADKEILIFEKRQLLHRLPINTLSESVSNIGLFQWSRRGDAIYALYRQHLESEQHQIGILELPIDGRSRRLLPLFVTSGSYEPLMLTVQFDISHDGNTLAMTTTHLGSAIEPEDRGLYLIDLSSADRRVTKVAVTSTAVRSDGVIQ